MTTIHISPRNFIKNAKAIATVAFVFLSIACASAQLPKLGGETSIHSATIQNEQEVSCAMDASGNFITAYTHLDVSGNHGIAVRRFNRKGEAVGTVAVPHSNTSAIQQQPSVAMSDDGRYVVVWEDNQLRDGNNYDVYFALYNAAGSMVGSVTRVNSTVSGARDNPRVAMNRSTGEFVVVFAGGNGGTISDVYYRRFSAAGVAMEAADQKVNVSTNSSDFAPSVAFSSNGTFVVAWEGDANSDFNFEANFQRYSFAGSSATPVGGNTVASQAGHDTTEVEVACDDAGSIVLAWVDGLPANGSDPKDLLFRRYDGGNTAVTPITVFKTGAFSGNGDVLVPRIRVAMENDDDFLLTYLHDDEIWAKFYTGLGVIKGSEIHVNTTTSGATGEFQSKPWVAINPVGNRAVIAWGGTGSTDNNGAHFQRFAEPNLAPTLGAIGNKSGAELQAITFTASATESALNFGDTITYSLGTTTTAGGVGAAPPPGASIHPTNGTFSWTPTELQGPGTYQITVLATDNGEPAMADLENITITVSEANQAPSNLTLSSSSINENVDAGTQIGTFSVFDADVPLQTIIYTLVAGTGSTDNASFSITGNVLSVGVSPDFETKASYSIRVKADDGAGGSVQKEFTITVLDVVEASVTNWTQY